MLPGINSTLQHSVTQAGHVWHYSWFLLNRADLGYLALAVRTIRRAKWSAEAQALQPFHSDWQLAFWTWLLSHMAGHLSQTRVSEWQLGRLRTTVGQAAVQLGRDKAIRNSGTMGYLRPDPGILKKKPISMISWNLGYPFDALTLWPISWDILGYLFQDYWVYRNFILGPGIVLSKKSELKPYHPRITWNRTC